MGRYALKKSILMDLVSKKGRGKCNAIDSITMFGWSGSAVLGGFLVDAYGYGVTFAATATLQAIGTLLFALILPLVPPEKNAKASAGRCCGGASEATALRARDSNQEPLLADEVRVKERQLQQLDPADFR
jgi:MFS family permease